jgi:hypothetical protein
MKKKIKYILFRSFANYIAASILLLSSGSVAYFLFSKPFDIFYLNSLALGWVVSKLLYSISVYIYHAASVHSLSFPKEILNLGIDEEGIKQMYIEEKAKDAL